MQDNLVDVDGDGDVNVDNDTHSGVDVDVDVNVDVVVDVMLALSMTSMPTSTYEKIQQLSDRRAGAKNEKRTKTHVSEELHENGRRHDVPHENLL